MRAKSRWFNKSPGRNGSVVTNMPEGLWVKCPKCAEIHFAKDVERNLRVCTKCEYHYRLHAHERISMTVDDGSFVVINDSVMSVDPLSFPGYPDKLSRAITSTGLTDAVVCGEAAIDGHKCVISAADFDFLGGSMGSAVGERLVRAMELSVDKRVPFVLFTANGGGARMFEGLLSLLQMAKTSAGLARMEQAAVPYIVVLTDPTMAGVYASYVSLGDVILAEPGALIGFAGRRVGNQDMGMKLPDDFQTSEFQYRCGMIDQIVHRRELRNTLATLLMHFAEEGTYVKASA